MEKGYSMQEKKTILFVDDSKTCRKRFAQILEDKYEIFTACDAREGLSYLRIHPERFCLALIDLRMRGMDGLQMIQTMREDERLRDIPAIILTGADDEKSEVRSLQSGVEDFIAKTVSPEILRTRVDAAVARMEEERRARALVRLAAVEAHERELETILENIGCGVTLLEVQDGDIRVTYINERACAFAGRAREDLEKAVADDFFCLSHPDEVAHVRALFGMHLQNGHSFEHTMRICKNEEAEDFHYVRVRAQRAEGSQRPMRYIVTYVDVDEEVRARETMRNMAELDELTGIYNRLAFLRRAQETVRGNPANYILLDINIERFKVINDVFGKSTGDAILCHIAQGMREGLGPDSICGRFDADHFAVCMPKTALDLQSLSEKASFPWRSKSVEIQVVLNFGVYELGEEDAELPVARMYDRASLAMQTIKGHYQNHYAVYDATLRDNMLREQEIRSEMRAALDRHDFVIYLQPVISLTSNQPVGAEALVRWKHPQKGLISPGEFIPLFEKTDFICELDRYVWHEVCHILQQRREKGLLPLPISVNASRRSLLNPNLVGEIDAISKEHDVSPMLLRVEVTESAYTSNPQQLLANIEKLRAAGFLILMDDFGSGYSSLNTLKDIPVDMLKVDMKFLEGFEKGGRVGTILTSIMRMAKWMNTAVIAEGVETAEQVDYLRSLGCDCVQGFYYARPMPVSQFEAYVGATVCTVPGDEALGVLGESENNMLMGGSELVNRLLSSVYGGVGIYEYSDGHLDVLRVNSAYYTIMGMTPAAITERGTDILAVMNEQEKSVLINAIERAVREKREQRFLFERRRWDNNAPLYLSSKVRHIGGSDERPLLCIAFSDITPQKKAEARYALLNENAARLIERENVEEAVRASLASILSFYAGDRAYILEFDWAEGEVDETYEECAEGVESQIESMQGVPLDTLDSWFGIIQEQKGFYVADAAQLPDEDMAKYIMAAKGVQSMLSVPLYSRARMIGMICVDTPRANVDDMDTLLTLGYYMTNEIYKRAHLHEVRVQQARLQELEEALREEKARSAALEAALAHSRGQREEAAEQEEA